MPQRRPVLSGCLFFFTLPQSCVHFFLPFFLFREKACSFPPPSASFPIPVSVPPPHRLRHQANFHLGRPAFVNSDHSSWSSKELIFPLWRGELQRRLMHMWSLFDAPIVCSPFFSSCRSHIAREFVSQLTCCFRGMVWIKNENKRRYYFSDILMFLFLFLRGHHLAICLRINMSLITKLWTLWGCLSFPDCCVSMVTQRYSCLCLQNKFESFDLWWMCYFFVLFFLHSTKCCPGWLDPTLSKPQQQPVRRWCVDRVAATESWSLVNSLGESQTLHCFPVSGETLSSRAFWPISKPHVLDKKATMRTNEAIAHCFSGIGVNHLLT